MRRNLGEAKTSADLDEIDEDIEFNKLWNMEHPTEAYDKSDDGNDFNRCVKFSEGEQTWWATASMIMRIAKLSCKHSNSVKNLHAHIIVTGLTLEIFIQSKLVNTYVMFGSLNNARKVFDKMSEPNASQAIHKIYKPNAFLWNVMIRERARSGLHKEALKVYCKMYEGGIQPDNFTFCAVLKACAGL
ncbi:pentatricopeptide repeat-containing protein At3g12770-like [Cryptomeria japonica]|uniref:pentatricopeptide repeat-containing protein At3g12770-like n=1 Tax=Cryptomeria japonica TaxID=3369 RepID=UPI0027DA9FB1|nr:pentatricopeptide repeat-containing protein At3g12770-like [Cryptomeria japonica]